MVDHSVLNEVVADAEGPDTGLESLVRVAVVGSAGPAPVLAGTDWRRERVSGG